MENNEIAAALAELANMLTAGCEKLPAGPMRENCEKKSKGGDSDSKGDKKKDDKGGKGKMPAEVLEKFKKKSSEVRAARELIALAKSLIAGYYIEVEEGEIDAYDLEEKAEFWLDGNVDFDNLEVHSNDKAGLESLRRDLESDRIEVSRVMRASIAAGCEKLPEGGMRDNCEKKSKGGDKKDDKDKKSAVVAHTLVKLAKMLTAKQEVPEAFKKEWKNKDKDGDGKENEPKPDFLKDKKSSRRASMDKVAAGIEVDIDVMDEDVAAEELHALGVKMVSNPRRGQIVFLVPPSAKRKVRRWMDKNGYDPDVYPEIFTASRRRASRRRRAEKIYDNGADGVAESEVFEYLDDLRESGRTNMFGAARYVESELGLDRREAKKALMSWMKNFK